MYERQRMEQILELPERPIKDWLELTRLEQVNYLAVNFGWKIIPLYGVDKGLCSCGGQHSANGSAIGKHPTISNWGDLASNDLEQLFVWFDGRDDLNYGIFMLGSGMMAIDIDVKAGGWDSWDLLDDRCQYDFVPTVEVSTGLRSFRGQNARGSHKYHKQVEGFRFDANLTKSGFPSIDLRHNGYIVGPGSMHASGVPYEWKPGHAPWEVEVAKLPEIALGYMGKKSKSASNFKPRVSLGDDEWEKQWSKLSSAALVATPCAKAALKNACQELSEMLPGSGRNNALNAKAFSLGRLVAGGQLCLAEAKGALRKAMEKTYGREFGVKETAVENTLRLWGGGFEAGALEPRFPKEVDSATQEWVSSQKIIKVGEFVKGDDLLSAARQGFLSRSGSLLRQSLERAVRSLGPIEVGPASELWSYSDGCWKRGGQDVVIFRAGRLLGEDARPAHTDNLIHFMKREQQTIHNLGPLEYFNLMNGMLDWQTGEVKSHSPSYYSTVQLPINWNLSATCPTVDKFLEQVVHEDLIELIWEIIGVCIYTGIGFQLAIFLDGTGRNGKGALLRLIEKLIPREFVAHVELQNLSKDKFATAQLFGKILSIVGDLSPKALSDASLFKQVTGQDTLSGEFKYGQTFSFTSQATLIFGANELPKTQDTTHGFFERLLIVPFDKVSLEKHEVDATLEPRMHLELEGVLLKAVDGLRRAMKRGSLKPVKRCEEALDRYRHGSINIQPWLVSTIQFTSDSQDRLPRKDLYESYSTWAEENAQDALKKPAFYEELTTECGDKARPLKSNGENYYEQIQFLEE